jgi:hypothetical protein
VQITLLGCNNITAESVQKGSERLLDELGTRAFVPSEHLKQAMWSDDGPVPVVNVVHMARLDPVALEQFVVDELNTKFDAGRCPFRFSLIQTNVGSQALAICYRHTISDAHGITLLLNRLLQMIRGSSETHVWNLRPPSIQSMFRENPCATGLWQRLKHAWSEQRLFSGCWRPTRRSTDDWSNGFVIHQTGLSADVLVQNSRDRQATVQEMLFAVVAEVMSLHQNESLSRRGIMLNTLVDLRRLKDRETDGTIGQFLGGFNVRVDVSASTRFQEILGVVKKQVRDAKRNSSYLHSPGAFETMATLWDLQPDCINRDLGPRLFPMAAGISNVQLSESFAPLIDDGFMDGYFRATGLGLMLPLMVTLTTYGSRFSLTATYRTALFDRSMVCEILQQVCGRLMARTKAREVVTVSGTGDSLISGD